MVEVFKTDVRDLSQTRMLIRKLRENFPKCRINFDLQDCDNILRVEGQNISTEKIKGLLASRGYHCEVLF